MADDVFAPGAQATPVSEIKQTAPDARDARVTRVHRQIVDHARGAQDGHLAAAKSPMVIAARKAAADRTAEYHRSRKRD